MLTTDLFKRIRRKGYLMAGYTFIKILGAAYALVLERILTEYQHALRNELLYDGAYFVLNINMLVFYLGISKKEIIDAINYLQELELINCTKFSSDEELILVRVYEDEIVDFEKTAESENRYKNWDYCLYTLQSRIYELPDDTGI